MSSSDDSRGDRLVSAEEASARRSRARPWRWLLAALAAALSVAGLMWFQPQRLFIDDRVDDALPATRSDREDAALAAPTETRRGEFISLDHATSGLVRTLRLPDGADVLRIEELDTENGPDLFVYLSASRAAGDEAAFDDDYVNLGRLKGNRGDQNYELPAHIDLDRYATVVIWCDRFDSAFGAADL